MNIRLGSAACVLILLVVLACDSPPWSRFIVANTSGSEIVVRFYKPYVRMASPYLYSPEEWAADGHFTSGNPEGTFKINEDEHYTEVSLIPGSAVEIDRARYPDVENNVEDNFLIERLDMHGSAGDVSWTGRREVFNNFKKEGGGPFWYIEGKSPRYVYYYK